jgi:tetratricopeptide (TPR) repeat protein
MKNDAQGALVAFRDGVQSDPTNIANYMGMDQALSMLNRPPRERVEALERYPNLDAAPPSLIFELILNSAEAGDFGKSETLFHNRFFPREEGGTNVRQVWIEVQLLKALAAAKEKHCEQALETAQHLGSEAPGLSFTRDGLEPILQSARTKYLLAKIYNDCGQSERASEKLQSASAASGPDQIRWARLAAQKLPGFDANQWQDRLQAAYVQAASRSDTSAYPSWWMYVAGSLAADLGQAKEADSRYRKALLLPDRMLAYHFTRLAMSSASP